MKIEKCQKESFALTGEALALEAPLPEDMARLMMR